jgi:hypothetical protein
MKLNIKKTEIMLTEREIIKQVHYILYSTKRPKAKLNGKHEIEKDTGELEAVLKRNRGFIKLNAKGTGLNIDIEMINYFFFLDEGTKNMEGWFITDAIFDDPIINKIIKNLLTDGLKRGSIDTIQQINKLKKK